MNFKSVLYTILIVGFLYLLPVILDGFVAIGHRSLDRQYLYQMAYNQSRSTNKTLLVIGDPDSGFVNHWFGRDYQCGDICLDLTGCPGCNQTIQGDLDQILPLLETNHYVVFISCTLEYIQKTTNLPHLWRVTYGDIYITPMEFWAPVNWFLPGTKRILLEYPPHHQNITWFDLPEWVQYFHQAYFWTSPFVIGEYQKKNSY